MSYDPFDAERDEMYEQISRELYPEHRIQAIAEFTAERLQSYYKNNSTVMRPAVDALQEGKRLKENGHSSAAVVFFVTAIELLLKATVLKPVVHGLVHSEGLADAIVQMVLGQSGFDRYSDLLAKLYIELVKIDIKSVRRSDGEKSLLSECTAQQRLRNSIVHQGAKASPEQAELARLVAVAVYDEVVAPMLGKLDLLVIEHGEIVPASKFRC
ncbi:hypothetical protein [Aquitalea sp. ASV15]|uniref:hypothetical protein n=1 Tax=Aquitalea sp. ASV15 TaxID=2795104 RepID=UPI0018EBFD0D|nr:hypothetical protein [Aquitalea sp. ASV15]